jgi:exosortase/archaeosortase family protein
MSGGAPAKALRNPAVGNASIGSARIPAGSEGFVEIEVAERAPICAASTPASKPAFINFAALHPSSYVLIALLATFVVLAPYSMHANWQQLGPYWARIASALVPGSTPVGDHVITPAADVIITWQCSGAENIQIFSMLFATVFLMNWKRMQTWKSVALYVAALAGLFTVNIARIVTIVVRAKETHYGLANVIALALLITLVWKIKWLRPTDAPSTPASN